MRSIVKEYCQPTCRLLVTASPATISSHLGDGAVCGVKFYLRTGECRISGDKQQMQHLIRVVNTYVDQLLGEETTDNFSHKLSISPKLHLNLTTVQLFDLWVILDQLDQEFLLLPTPEIKKPYPWWWLVILGACIGLGGYWWHSSQNPSSESTITISQTIFPDRPESKPEAVNQPVLSPQPMTKPEPGTHKASAPSSDSDVVTSGVVPSITIKIVKFTSTDPKIKLSQGQKARAVLMLQDHWQGLSNSPLPEQLPYSFTLQLTIAKTKTDSIVTLQVPHPQKQWQKLLLQNTNQLNTKLKFLPAGKYTVHILISESGLNK